MSRWRRDDEGIAMVLVIGIAALFIAASLLAIDLADVSLKGSSRHVSYEQELHLAENGIDKVLARLQENDDWFTTIVPAPLVGSSKATEKAWALANLATAESAPGGSYAYAKPLGRNVIYAVGWDKSKSGPSAGRVLKAEYLFSTYHPEGAIVSGGDLKIGGSAGVDGILGDVHANGDINFSGSAATISGQITASGSISGGGGVTSGGQTSGAPQKTLPPVDTLEMWTLLSARDPSNWYDLCSDGTARSPLGAGAPCTGAVILYQPGVNFGSFRGWTYKSSTQEWEKDGSAEYDGVYFVDEGTARITKSIGTDANPWRATIITRSAEITGTCEGEWGDIEVSGAPNMRGFIDGLTLVSGRDLHITGNPSQEFNGVLAAHEQVFISGNPTVVGSVLAESACDSDGSPVDVTEISGSMQITYDDNLDVQVGNLIRTSLWLEL